MIKCEDGLIEHFFSDKFQRYLTRVSLTAEAFEALTAHTEKNLSKYQDGILRGTVDRDRAFQNMILGRVTEKACALVLGIPRWAPPDWKEHGDRGWDLEVPGRLKLGVRASYQAIGEGHILDRDGNSRYKVYATIFCYQTEPLSVTLWGCIGAARAQRIFEDLHSRNVGLTPGSVGEHVKYLKPISSLYWYLHKKTLWPIHPELLRKAPEEMWDRHRRDGQWTA